MGSANATSAKPTSVNTTSANTTTTTTTTTNITIATTTKTTTTTRASGECSGGHGGEIAGYTILTLLILSCICGLAWYINKRQTRRIPYQDLSRRGSTRSSICSYEERPTFEEIFTNLSEPAISYSIADPASRTEPRHSAQAASRITEPAPVMQLVDFDDVL